MRILALDVSQKSNNNIQKNKFEQTEYEKNKIDKISDLYIEKNTEKNL